MRDPLCISRVGVACHVLLFPRGASLLGRFLEFAERFGGSSFASCSRKIQSRKCYGIMDHPPSLSNILGSPLWETSGGEITSEVFEWLALIVFRRGRRCKKISHKSGGRDCVSILDVKDKVPCRVFGSQGVKDSSPVIIRTNPHAEAIWCHIPAPCHALLLYTLKRRIQSTSKSSPSLLN